MLLYCQESFCLVERSHIFVSFASWCSASRLLELCQVSWPVTEWKGRSHLLQHSGLRKLAEKKERGRKVGKNTEKKGRVGGTKVSSVKKIFFAFCVTTVPYCPLRKCHFALGRQLSEARLICLTAFTEMFCGHIQRSLGGVSLCFVCPTTPNHIAPKK